MQTVAVVESSADAGGVLELTEAARRCGVEIGMTSAQAQARCGSLQLLARQPTQEAVLQTALLQYAATFSPEIEATAEGMVTLNLRGARIADFNAWGREALARLERLELQGRMGIAPNPDLAGLAARRAESVLVVQNAGTFLADLTIASLDPAPELLAVLRDWGLGHLGDLARIPRAELVDRLGSAADELWLQAAGRADRLLRLVRVPEEFVERFEFDYAIETVEPLLFLLRRFLERLCARLKEAHRVASEMMLTLGLEDGTAYERAFTIPSPTANEEVLFRILHTHLEGLQFEQRPAGLRLRIEPVSPRNDQWQLFENPLRDPNRFGETLARLAALVGSENVGVAQIENSHRPDRFRLVEPRFDERWEEPEPGRNNAPAGLPLRRFRPARPAQVHTVRQIPVCVFSESTHGEVLDALGPYRGSGAWWDSEAWAVEEWDVELADGSLWRLAKKSGAWFIEGIYEDAAVH
jgi:protein ImuB